MDLSAGELGNGRKRARPDDQAQEHGEAKRLALVPWPPHQQHPSSRIYRVSRGSGGKDRHSKVYTAKGIRDRRVRLSVATAIQFYDLQDRLGYDQPSKAVEWLIKAAAAAIDKLPSLDATAFPNHPASANNTKAREEPAADADADADGPQQQLTRSGCSSTSETSKGSVLSLANGPSDHGANAYNGGGGSGTFAELLHSSATADKSMQQQPTLAYYATPQSSPMSFEMFPQLAYSQEQHHHHHAAVAFDRSTLQSNAVAVPMWPPSQYPFMMQRFPVAPAGASPTFPFFLGSGGSSTAPATSNAPERRLQLWDFKEERKT